MRKLPASVYLGGIFDSNVSPMSIRDRAHLPAIWCFCSSPEYSKAVRRIDQKLNVTNATLAKVPFDLEYWQSVAEEKYPNGLPEPHSNDPTQWLFKGDVATSDNPLHVAVARLLGYEWPDQAPDELDAFANDGGVVCLPPIVGEDPAARRVETLLAAAYGASFTPQTVQRLVAADLHPADDLTTWLRDSFFASHCRLFHNRPFLWHIWDGRKDGFSAIVNYHKLDRANLERLIYHYLGAGWIREQRHAAENGEAGAEGRLIAALELQAKLEVILYGEPDYDIFVRWKPLDEQPIGWEPDLNDGVRMNIRPFVEAGVLRSKFTIHWNKDRGTNPPGSPYGADRLNNLHITRQEKVQARAERQAKLQRESEVAAAAAARATEMPMDPPAFAVAGDTDLFGIPQPKDLFGQIVEQDIRRKRKRY
jgi:hypothetical protein